MELIARLAKGGLRDAITLFEQYSAGGVLKRKYIEENLELIGEDFLLAFVKALIEKDTDQTLAHLISLRDKSLDVRLFLEQLLFFLRDRMKDSLKKIEFSSYAQLFEIFEGIYGRLKFTPDPFLLLETSVFRCIATSELSCLHTTLTPTPPQKEREAKKDGKSSSLPPRHASLGTEPVKEGIVSPSSP